MLNITSFEAIFGSSLAYKPNKNKRSLDVRNILTKLAGETDYSLNLSFGKIKHFLIDFAHWEEDGQVSGHIFRSLNIVSDNGDCFKLELLKRIKGWAFFKEDSKGVRTLYRDLPLGSFENNKFEKKKIHDLTIDPNRFSVQIVGFESFIGIHIVELRFKSGKPENCSNFVFVLFLEDEISKDYHSFYWLSKVLSVTLSEK